MARENKTRDALHNQKKGVCVAVAALLEADILSDGAVYVQLPERVLIISVIISVTTVSTTGSSTLDVLVGADVVANEVAITTAGAIVGTVVTGKAYLATGGELIVKSGSTAPAAGDFVGELIVEYIELDKNTGEMTTYLPS